MSLYKHNRVYSDIYRVVFLLFVYIRIFEAISIKIFADIQQNLLKTYVIRKSVFNT